MPCRQERPSPALLAQENSDAIPPRALRSTCHRCAVRVRRAVDRLARYQFQRSMVEPQRIRLGGVGSAAIRHVVHRPFRLRHRRPPAVVHRRRVLPAAKRPVPVQRRPLRDHGPVVRLVLQPRGRFGAARRHTAVRCQQHRFRNAHVLRGRRARGQVDPAAIVRVRGFHRQLLRRIRLRPEQLSRIRRTTGTSRSWARSRSTIPPTIRSHSRCSRISARVRSRATTVNSVTWVRSTPLIHVRTASTAR